ncbi:head-tail connector protein [Pararhizobium sp. BT-229]|uniref:head-tail connector protein n=1 Tax=Pararhizobium sp. BT-229 TaxID=2986923 RepID=UPI0021F71D08|nr:head-tail connector protein [Pararhizobium sp. BT-229]MCV9965462.1 head-tail connector protein [Pararhizobium sp. BT-229]
MADVVITALGPLYTLAEVKQHLLVEQDDDDTIIQTYMDAAEAQVLKYCNLSLVPYGADAVFRVAALMAISEFYNNRGTADALPASSRMLINPYRWLRV